MDGILNDVVTLSWVSQHYDVCNRSLRELCERTQAGKHTKLAKNEVAKSGNTWIISYSAILRLYGQTREETNE